jgi:hypothetical protein
MMRGSKTTKMSGKGLHSTWINQIASIEIEIEIARD